VRGPAKLSGPLSAPRLVRKAVILAAGRGRRMGRLTADRPKAALSVGGRALLDWQIGALHAAGIEEVAVVTGHGASALAGRDVHYTHNPDWAAGTQVASLLSADAWIGNEPLIVSYGDILYHPSAAIALRERPGDIVVAYDADHRWLWKRRFGNWLKDSETFRLGPGQVLAEIGRKPHDIDEVEGQFMGLMLMTAAGLKRLTRAVCELGAVETRHADFTGILSRLIAQGVRIDTAANLLPWMEVDSRRDLEIANAMAARDPLTGRRAELYFPDELKPFAEICPVDASALAEDASVAPDGIRPDATAYRVDRVVAVQNWGRSGSTFLQSLLDGHPQVLSTPNFYSRAYYLAWASQISLCPDAVKIDAFLGAMRQWWDPAQVDATAGLHRLGPALNEVAGVVRADLERHLRAAFSDGRRITRRALFEAAHVAYTLALDREIAPPADRAIVYPVHSRARGSACALLEDFPEARFVHTLREPIANVAASIRHLTANKRDLASDALLSAVSNLFGRQASGADRVTRFGDRPYLDYLSRTDRVRFLPLESLHRGGSETINALAGWIGLDASPSLTRSTFDAKSWWNRPESGTESHLGKLPSGTPAETLLGRAERDCIALLAARVPALRQAYYADTPVADIGLLTRLAAALRPWRYERHASVSDLRALEALGGLRLCLPAPLHDPLQVALRFERKRAALVGQAHGATEARKRLPPDRYAETIGLQIVLQPIGSDWRLGLRLHPSNDPAPRGPDVVVVTPADGTVCVDTLRRQVFWRLALPVGRLVAAAATFVRLRRLLLELLIWRWGQQV